MKHATQKCIIDLYNVSKTIFVLRNNVQGTTFQHHIKAPDDLETIVTEKKH